MTSLLPKSPHRHHAAGSAVRVLNDILKRKLSAGA